MRVSDILIELAPGDGEKGGGEYRTVSDRIMVGRVQVSAAQETSTKEWRRVVKISVTKPGDVEAIYTDNITRHPADERLLASVFSWLQKQGLPDLREKADVNVLGCMAAHFHHDIAAFSDCLFCVVWLEDACGLDLVFPETGRRIPLEKGSVVLFDAGQPHGVLHTGQTRYYRSQYVDLPAQVFLSIDFAANAPDVARAMGIQLRENPTGWPGVMVDIDSDGPELSDTTGKWRTRLPRRAARVSAT